MRWRAASPQAAAVCGSPASRGDNQPTNPGTGLAVIVYGRVQGDAGAFVTNADTRGAIIFASQGSQTAPLAGFADFSVVNGCALLASAACGGAVAPAQEMAVVTIGTDVQGIVEGALSSTDDAVAAVPDVRLTTVIDTAALTTNSIISDPVASAGNPSLWESSVADGPAGSRGEDEEERKRAQRGRAADDPLPSLHRARCARRRGARAGRRAGGRRRRARQFPDRLGRRALPVQARPLDPAMKGMFDRAYAIVCRDAAAAGRPDLCAARAAPTIRSPRCWRGGAEPREVRRRRRRPMIEAIGGVTLGECTRRKGDVGYRVYARHARQDDLCRRGARRL